MLTTTEFDGSRAMHEHIIEMTNIATRLKTLGMVEKWELPCAFYS